MVSYLVKLLFLVLFSFFIIYSFYFNFPVHQESFNGYTGYFFIVGIIYAIYKYLQVTLNIGGVVKYSPFKIFCFFVLHLFILSILFFTLNGASAAEGISLFFKILYYSLLPIILIFISTGFGYKALGYVEDFKNRNTVFKFITALAVGFFSFTFLLTILGVLGFYNLYAVFGILILMLALSYKNFSGLVESFFTYNFEAKLTEGYYVKLITAEFFFLIITLVISTNLISVIRPFPIGWDDLGAYMNQPQLFANAGTLAGFGGMTAWQTITGIGYMFKSPVQAFFLNNMGGVLSVIVLALVVFDLIKSKTKSLFINIPLLASAIFISMPTVVFQQAKDMKLDTGLFFVSIIGLYLLFTVILKGFYEKQIDKKSILKYLFIVGLIAGFAFTIKFTSLLFISALFGVLVYSKLNIEGLLGYMGIFFAIFTKLGLWGYMNVVYPKDDTSFINIFSLVSGAVGVALISFAINKYKINIQNFFIKIGIVLCGILVAVLPWVGKNIYSAGSDLSVGTILSGKPDRFVTDYTKLYSQEELEIKKQDLITNQISASGTTQNEDWGRYFGYEKGINNYVKLPWNLTMQVNQGGEFTGLGFIFLALLPTLFLFLPYRKEKYYFGAVLFIAGIFLLHGPAITGDLFTKFFESFSLPGGYSVLLAIYLIPSLYLFYTLKDTKRTQLYKLNLAFTVFYVFLWAISAFGVVWYGIVMYFNFLLMIGLGLYYLSSYNQDDPEKEVDIKAFASIMVLVVIMVHFFNSVFPHTFKNLKAAGYKEYKTNLLNTTEAPYLYHREYLPILFALNITDDKKQEYLSSILSDEVKKAVPNLENRDVNTVNAILRQLIQSGDSILSTKALQDINKLYGGITHPKEEFKSKIGIYRIGTFLKYYISENNNRLLEDSLITQFDNYIFTGNTNTTVDNIKKLGLGYLLVDLNAATIDKDPRHALTKRYENLMSVYKSDQLELVDTDSLCLKIGLEDYHKLEKTKENLNHYTLLAGVNFESYDEQGNQIHRRNKLTYCYNYILSLQANNAVDQENYPYLLPLMQELQGKNTAEAVTPILQRRVNAGYKALFRVK